MLIVHVHVQVKPESVTEFPAGDHRERPPRAIPISFPLNRLIFLPASNLSRSLPPWPAQPPTGHPRSHRIVIPMSPATAISFTHSRVSREPGHRFQCVPGGLMIDFLLGFAFVAMLLSPGIVSALHRARTRERDNP